GRAQSGTTRAGESSGLELAGEAPKPRDGAGVRGMNDRILKAARRQAVDRPPVWIMRQAGRYLPEYRAIREEVPFLTLCKTPELPAEVRVQLVRRLGVDAAIIFSDILIPVEAMGMELELGDKGPHLPHPLRTQADIDRLVVPDPGATMGFLGDAIRKTCSVLQ